MKPENWEQKIYEDYFPLEVELPIKKEKHMKDNTWGFLKATRFWALVIGAVVFYLQAKGIIGEAEMVLANTILGGFITIKTVDKFGEQKVLAAKEAGSVTTVSMPESVTTVTASTDKVGVV